MPARASLTSLRGRPVQMLQRPSARCCTCVEAIININAGWGVTGRRAAPSRSKERILGLLVDERINMSL